MTTAADLDDDKIQKLEAELDPEMRFRPLLPVAAWIVAAALFGLSCFHYYTAGFGLAAGDAPPRHSHLLRARADLPRLLVEQEGQYRAAEGRACVAPLGIGIDRLALLYRGRRHQPLRPVRVPRSPVPRRQSRPDRLDHGHRHDRGAARGDAPQRRLAAADHRGRADGLCAVRPQSCRAFSRTPATPGKASSITSISRARASTASRSASSPPTSSITCCSACSRRASGSAASSSILRPR